MKKIIYKVIIALIIFLIVLGGYSVYYKCHDTPLNAIKIYSYMHGYTVTKDFDAKESGYYKGNGIQFGVKGVTTKQGPITFFYLEKSQSNLWYVKSCGSGP